MSNLIVRNKAFTLMAGFSQKEMSDFRRFILSPFYNHSKKVIKLFDAIRYHHPGFNSRSLNYDTIYRKIFGKKCVNNRVINNLFTKLTNLAVLFMSTSNFSKNTMIADSCLLNEYRARGLDPMLTKAATRMVSAAGTNKEKDTSDYYHYFNYRFHLVEYEFRTLLMGREKNIAGQLTELHGLAANYYYHNLLKIFTRAVITSLIDSKYIDRSFYGLLKEILSPPANVTHPAKSIFSGIAQCFLNNKPVKYIKLRGELDNIRDSITGEDYNLALILLGSHFMPVINEEDKQMVSQRFGLVKLLVERQAWLTVGGEFVEQNFTHVVNSGLRAGAYEWTEKFIRDYSRYINKQHRADAVNYSLARVYYEKGRSEKHDIFKYFEIAREYLYQYRTKDLSRKIKAYELDTMILFETEQFDQMTYHCDKYIHYLKHHAGSIDGAVLNSHLNFAEFSAKVAKLTIDKNLKKITLLKPRIKSSKFCLNKLWLIEKAEKVKIS